VTVLNYKVFRNIKIITPAVCRSNPLPYCMFSSG